METYPTNKPGVCGTNEAATNKKLATLRRRADISNLAFATSSAQQKDISTTIRADKSGKMPTCAKRQAWADPPTFRHPRRGDYNEESITLKDKVADHGDQFYRPSSILTERYKSQQLQTKLKKRKPRIGEW
jgi:hypothetical protein